MTGSDWFDLVGLAVSIITAGSIIFAAIQIVSQTRQMHREFEALYVQRYGPSWIDDRSPSSGVVNRVVPTTS